MKRRDATLRSIARRKARLCNDPVRYIRKTDSVFSGPSVYFHREALSQLRRCGRPRTACTDPRFLELLYATLTSWGMHRMGTGGAKLVEMAVFRQSLRQLRHRIDALRALRIDRLPANPQPIFVELWSIISALRVSRSQTSKVVAGSKTLHHLLPNLVPPIDREYSAEFFRWKGMMQGREREMFFDVFPQLVDIGKCIRPRISRLGHSGWYTSLTKNIDNAIIGYWK